MSPSLEEEDPEELEFMWGKKRGIGGKNKDVRFYESFTYDGVDYNLYDCVYMHKEGELAPYIGKLVKIWENGDKSRKIKVQWFFRPQEICHFLKDVEFLENELFMASGTGKGLMNINPLEVIGGKCNVVCISEDSRNPQPSAEERQRADYVFYRTFDVKNSTISDQIDHTVGGLEVKLVFNKNESDMTCDLDKIDSTDKAGEKSIVEVKETSTLALEDWLQQSKNVELNGSYHMLEKEPVTLCKSSLGVQINSNKDREVIDSVKKSITSGIKNAEFKDSSAKDKVQSIESPVHQVQVEDRMKPVRKSITSDYALSKSLQLHNGKSRCQLDSGEPQTTKLDKTSSGLIKSQLKRSVDLNEKPQCGAGHEIKDIPLTMDSCHVEEGPTKKMKFDDSIGTSKDNNNVTIKKLKKIGSSKMIGPPSLLASNEGNPKSRINNGPPKEYLNEKTTNLSKNDLPKIPITKSKGDDKKVGQTYEVTRRPFAEKGNWMKLPWEQRMRTADDQGKLLLLQNLDPRYTSGVVEDIMWHTFEENCTAKMVQQTATSNPHCGQAFVIFKTREAAEKVVKKLDDGCLILPNRRPLVGCIGVFPKFEKQTTFFGHLAIDKARMQMQRELKEAVSTSHYSQNNTIEYEMAMAWCWQQSKYDKCWEKLHEQQRAEIEKLTADLKPKPKPNK